MSKFLLALTCCALGPVLISTGQAQTVASKGSTTGSTMPGSATDFIFFNTADYPFNGPVQDNGTSYVHLTDFTINGGLQGQNGFGSDASITTPGGTNVQTGFIASNGPGAAFALTPTPSSGSPFNYNDFNVYLMISNTDGNLNDLTVSLDPRISGAVNIGGNSVGVTDNSTAGTNSAEYVEFNVSGFGADLTNGTGDLVVSATSNRYDAGAETYIGAVSFESVPEPSTYAMMLGGLALLGFCIRRKLA